MIPGQVEEFDEARGLGVVVTAEGDRYPFHSTAIADGTRTIPVGAKAVFRIVPGSSGRWEAGSVTRI
ncbi:MAG TPA: hypothetical protein VF045_00860 [Acidimicrobiales bacterium]